MTSDETMDRIALLVLRGRLVRFDGDYERHYPALTTRVVAEIERRAIRLHLSGKAA